LRLFVCTVEKERQDDRLLPNPIRGPLCVCARERPGLLKREGERMKMCVGSVCDVPPAHGVPAHLRVPVNSTSCRPTGHHSHQRQPQAPPLSALHSLTPDTWLLNKDVDACTHTHTHTHRRGCMHTHTHTHRRGCMHTHTHTHTRGRTHTHTHTHPPLQT